MADLGAAVARWVTVNRRPLVLVGQSIGTQLAAHAAVQAPDLLRMLVLHGPTVDPEYRTTRRLMSRWARDAPTEPTWLARSQFPEWCQVGPRRLVKLIGACLDDRLETTLVNVDQRVPTRVVLGDHDRLCRRSWGASLTDSKVELLRGGHAAGAAQPLAFATLISRLAEEIA
jgi:pimeloyl-ACP methyl ester carboxylesterase